MKPQSVHAVLIGKVKLPAHPRHGELSPDAYAVTVSGNELAPRICDGDTLAVDPAVAPYPGCHVVVWPAAAQGEPLVRRLAEEGEPADKPDPLATVHVVTWIYRQEGRRGWKR
jgi:hypothetical protein